MYLLWGHGHASLYDGRISNFWDKTIINEKKEDVKTGEMVKNEKKGGGKRMKKFYISENKRK